MIRHLHPTDSPALLQFKQRTGPDEVCTLSQAVKGGEKSFPLMKYTTIALSPRAWQSCWVKTRRAMVQAVMRAGTRSGPLAWEIGDLFLARKDRGIAVEVMEQVAFPAGSSGARRIFVRVPSGSDLFEAARAAGYQAVFTEMLYKAPSAREVLNEIGEHESGLKLRALDDEDRHSLFRLYCSAVPIDARSRMGQTMEEWASSIERGGKKVEDWGVDNPKSAGLQAHVQSRELAGGRYFSVCRSKDAPCRVEDLVAAGLDEAGERQAFSLVPSYDQKLAVTLEELRFTCSETYDVMVKTLAVPATKTVPGFAIAEP